MIAGGKNAGIGLLVKAVNATDCSVILGDNIKLQGFPILQAVYPNPEIS